ncbi:MAG: hypothetical protein KIT44_04150 [Opitutaceae bacterium]|nr:hypothetical protein [Opitutaceae bacterium]
MTMAGRQRGWLSLDFHAAFREILRHASNSYRIVVPAYCLMPDHFHLLAAGIAPDSDQLLWTRAIRRSLNQHLAPRRLQKQAYDHVLRTDESDRDSFTALVHYLCENPVRARLAPRPVDWPYCGTCVPLRPDLDPRLPNFREEWWAYWVSLHP